MSTSGALTTPLMYTEQHLDSESGLYYNRARYYDPTTAQFMSVDPLVSSTRSPFGYAGGDPLDKTDPAARRRTTLTRTMRTTGRIRTASRSTIPAQTSMRTCR